LKRSLNGTVKTEEDLTQRRRCALANNTLFCLVVLFSPMVKVMNLSAATAENFRAIQRPSEFILDEQVNQNQYSGNGFGEEAVDPASLTAAACIQGHTQAILELFRGP
jgi:hypothetical protein